MRTIDMHSHVVPQALWRAAAAGKDWYGARFEPDEGHGSVVFAGKRSRFASPKVRFTPEERIKDIDALGVDTHVVSIHTPFVGYHLDLAQGRQLAREVNDEIAEMAKAAPKRFVGMATLPMQDVRAAIEELDRAVHVLGLKGAELDTVVNGLNWDEPQFLPLFQAAEQMGAVLFFHPQPQHNLMMPFTSKYNLPNSLGVITEDTMLVATLIFGGIFDACPKLKACIAHGGGPALFGMGRLDHGWMVRREARVKIQNPPSSYIRHFYYDTVVGSEAALRFTIDAAGIDRVVLGSDWPFVRWDPSPVAWVKGLKKLTADEKEKILWKNVEALLSL